MSHAVAPDVPSDEVAQFANQVLQRINNATNFTGNAPSTPPPSSANVVSDLVVIPHRKEADALAEKAMSDAPEVWARVKHQYNLLYGDFINEEPEEGLQKSAKLVFLAIHSKYIQRQIDPIFPNLKNIHEDPVWYISCVKEALSQNRAFGANITEDQGLAYLLHSLRRDRSEPGSKAAGHQSIKLQPYLARHIARQYRGGAVARFMRFVQSVNRNMVSETVDRDVFFKGTPIVQSSGTGKTRLAFELGREAPLLYICLRKLDANSTHGFPFGDQAVMKYF